MVSSAATRSGSYNPKQPRSPAATPTRRGRGLRCSRAESSSLPAAACAAAGRSGTLAVAIGIDADGHREILSLDVATAEDGADPGGA
uniref:transposase n=1 Tax=Streptomyces albiflavescens TaxID=1623582 RepID=UPI00357162DC